MAIFISDNFDLYDIEPKELIMKPTTVHVKPLVTGMKFGIELEIEAAGLYETEEVFDSEDEEYHTEDPDIPRGWLKEQEDSIVGCELISEVPVSYEEACSQIELLFRDIRDNHGFSPIRTPRGSMHVHANVADLTWEQMKSFTMACAWAEPALIELAGKGRKGNLFAQSYEICPIGWQGIIDAARAEDSVMPHDTHYMATSFYPMMTLGSVEFRMGPSARTASEAIDWLRNIMHVVRCGREDEVTPGKPLDCLGYLMAQINPMKYDVVMRKAQHQADEIWCALNRKYIKKRNKFQELADQYQLANPAVNTTAEQISSQGYQISVLPGPAISQPVPMDIPPPPPLSQGEAWDIWFNEHIAGTATAEEEPVQVTHTMINPSYLEF